MSKFDWRSVKVSITDAEALKEIDPEALRVFVENAGYSFTEKWRFSDAYGIGGKTHAIYIPTAHIADFASVMAANVTELSEHCGISELFVLKRLHEYGKERTKYETQILP